MAKKELTDTQLKAQARAAAAKALAEQYPDAYKKAMLKEHEARGVEYKPRLSAEERAAQQVAALLEQYPGIRDEVPF